MKKELITKDTKVKVGDYVMIVNNLDNSYCILKLIEIYPNLTAYSEFVIFSSNKYNDLRGNRTYILIDPRANEKGTSKTYLLPSARILF